MTPCYLGRFIFQILNPEFAHLKAGGTKNWLLGKTSLLTYKMGIVTVPISWYYYKD